MKILTTCTLILCTAFLYYGTAQSTDFPSGSATWKYASGDPYSDPSVGSIVSLEGDTIIGGLTYQITSEGFFRTENKQVYFIPKDSIEAYLLYDFNLELGDIFLNKWPENNGPDTIFVNQVDSILIETGYRKRWRFGPGEGEWIDGIGSTWSLTRPLYLSPGSVWSTLHCFENEGESVFVNDIVYVIGYYYNETDTLRCYDPIVSTSELMANKEQIRIGPTPTENKLKIFSPVISSGTLVRINNTNGQIVQEVSYQDEIIVERLPPGVYFLSFLLEGKQYVEKIIKF